MKFSPDNSILQRISVRQFQSTDSEKVTEIVKSQSIMFGSDITEHHDYFINHLTSEKNKMAKTFVGFIDDSLVGVLRMNLWENIPFWSVGLNFTLKDESLNYIKNRAVSLLMYDTAMRYAESHNYYDGYIAICDVGSDHRVRAKLHDSLWPSIPNNYDIKIVEVIKPFTKSKFPTFELMMGPLSEKNKRTVMIRHSHFVGVRNNI